MEEVLGHSDPNEVNPASKTWPMCIKYIQNKRPALFICEPLITSVAEEEGRFWKIAFQS